MSEELHKPVMAIILGGPAGIGPETVAQTRRSAMIYDICKPFVIGHRDSFEQAMKVCNVDALKIHMISDPGEAYYRYGTVDLLQTDAANDAKIEYGYPP